jgi:subtilase family serine protease
MTHSLRIRCSFVAATYLLLCCSCGFAQIAAAGQRGRIVSPIVDSDVVTLAGNTHPLARPDFDRGAVADDTRLDRMILLLQPDAGQQKTLDALTEAQQQPGSAYYHQWLTPAQYGSSFGASPSDLAQIARWLQSHGFAVEPVAAGRRSILFSGTAGQVADAFHTEIHRYEVAGQMHIANAQDPQIPAALAPVVAGIVSLHDFRRVSEMRSIREIGRQPGHDSSPESGNDAANSTRRDTARPQYSQGSTHYIFPADFAAIYDLNPQYAAGNNGAGASIAIVGRSNINLSDVSSFRSYAALPANQPAVILEGADPGLVSGDQDESTLDVEWSGAVAPGAAVKFVVGTSTATTDGVDLSAQYIVNNKTATVMSTSYGSCEADMGSGELAFYNSLWQQAASEGISSFVSSGDSGAAGCYSGSSASASGKGINGLCSSPYSTCVGGTEFNEGSGNYWAAANGTGGGSALSYIPEKVWNESGSDGGSGLWASTGGISMAYTQPAWQAGVPGATSNGMRAVPDVALTAAGHDGYIICENGSLWIIAGTSAASPSFAGIMSIVDQKQGGTGQGNANPTLYSMLDASENPFHATPAGNNSVPGVTGYTASGAAYNLATGLGSVDANLLVNGWPAAGTPLPQPGFTLTPSVASESLLPGKSVTFTVKVAATGSFSGTVALTAKGPSGVTVAFSPASVKSGSSATATLSVASSAAAGASSITITGASGAISATSSVSLTIQQQPSLAVSAAASKVTIVQGATATLAVTVTTGGAYAGPITLAATGLPSGVTATWSGNGSSASGASTTVSTLTLKAATNAALTSAAMTITASGDGLQSKIQCTAQVLQAPAVALSLSPSAINMKSNAVQQVVVTATPTGGAKPSATTSSFQIAGLPAGITASWGAPSLTAAGALQVTLTLAGSSSAITSSSRPTITAQVHDSATGSLYTATAAATLTVTHSNSLAASTALAAVGLGKGKSVSDPITISTANTFHTAVGLAITGLPTGVSATWSVNPVTPDGTTGIGSATLTLQSASTAPLETKAATVTATGGGISVTKSISIKVTN